MEYSIEDVILEYDNLVNNGLANPIDTFTIFTSSYRSIEHRGKIRVLEGMTIMYRLLIMKLNDLHQELAQNLIGVISGKDDSQLTKLTNTAMKILQWVTRVLLVEEDPQLCQTIVLFYYTNVDTLPIIPFTRLEGKFQQMHQVLYDENKVYAKVADAYQESL